MIEYRKAAVKDISELKALIWHFGPNEWNHLTLEGVNEQFSLVEQGNAQVIAAQHNGKLIGLAVLIDGPLSPSYLVKYGAMQSMKFVGDVVVSSLHTGKGVATSLLKQCISQAKHSNASTVLIERHQQNLASAAMMHKAGFEVIDTFYDPEKRTSGSKNSVILQFKI